MKQQTDVGDQNLNCTVGKLLKELLTPSVAFDSSAHALAKSSNFSLLLQQSGLDSTKQQERCFHDVFFFSLWAFNL